MKSFIKTFSIALGSAILSIFIYDVYFKTTDLVLKNNIPQVLVEFNTVLSKDAALACSKYLFLAISPTSNRGMVSASFATNKSLK